MAQTVAVIVGSLRRESFSRKLALALASLAPPTLKLDIVEIGAPTLYDQDGKAEAPESWTVFREAVKARGRRSAFPG